MRKENLLIITFFHFIIATIVASCARMGQPDGGWYDDDPPKVIGSSPLDQSANVHSKKITIFFDEYIKLEDATNKVIVSPPQLEMPEIKAAGKRIIVELKDTLKENTTYTIDFSDAITDNNEGNPMGNYTYCFSTGEQIDTFEVAGYVLDASNLEPIKGIMVGLYDDLADSAFKTKPVLRVSRTDGSGHFVVKGVAPGKYRAYALKDADGDFVFNQKSEMVAFRHDIYEPSWKPDTRVDTVWRDSLHIDALLQVPYTHFLPDDVTLLAFTQTQTDRYLLKTERKDANKFSMYFSYGHPELPVIKGLNFNADSAFVIETGEKQDTIHYWLRDTTLVNQDTLRMEISYMMTDTLGVLVNQTDTVDVLAKTPYEKRMKEKAKELEKWEKEQEKKKKRGEKYDSIYKEKPLEPKFNLPQTMTPENKVTVEMPTPLARCDTSMVHLYSMIDSVWYESTCTFEPIEYKLREYRILADWKPGIEYSLEIDSAAFEDIYGKVSDPFKQGVKIDTEEKYSSLKLTLSGIPDTVQVIVQLLNASDAVVKETRLEKKVATFKYVKPDKYYVRALVDLNGNGIWDTGDYDKDLQAEAVYYYPREIECKEKWDVTQNWNVLSTPIHKQKPAKITKQKPDAAKKLKNRNIQRAQELGIQYVRSEKIKVKSE